MDVQAYLKRINYQGPLATTAESLRALHLAHLQNVPFENLDIHLGNPISLNESDLYEKIVVRGRGGFCYELNGLFAWLLREMGFTVTLMSARVGDREDVFGPEFDHLTLRVTCPADPIMPEAPWLVDVGFGDSFENPLRLDRRNRAQKDRTGDYRIDEGEDYLALWQKRDSAWKEQYRFTLQPRQLHEFRGMCRYHQTSPESHFTRSRVCSRATENGRLTLSEEKLISSEAGQRVEWPVEKSEYQAILKNQFGISLEQDFLGNDEQSK